MVTTSCPSGWTTSGSKCFRVINLLIRVINSVHQYFSDSTDFLSAEKRCIAEGGQLAKIESADENAAVAGLCPTGEVCWIGLADFLNEGNFEWTDGDALGGYTNWRSNPPQPDNGAQTANGIDQVN